MWYVAQVQAGRESSTLEMCRRLVPPSVMEDCFMPEYEVMWKIRGEWRLVKRLLFPGYLFFVTDDAEALNRELSLIIAAEMLRRSRLRCCGVPRCAATR